MSLRRPTNHSGANSNPANFKPQGAANDRYCMKCQCWRPAKGGRYMPGTKLWICADEHGKQASK